ncbi:MarR family transcriptional regulator [bacterium]|nr:MAG: MarR family transcriptional regulator [bacterium]
MASERSPRRGLEELEESPCYQLWRASNAWQRTLRRSLDPLGLTHTQFIVLSITGRLARVESCVTQSMIHEAADLDENLTSQVVRSLQTKGLVDRGRHPEDRRAVSVVVTEEGQRMIEKGRAAIHASKEAFTAPVGDRKPELTDLLRSIADAAAS